MNRLKQKHVKKGLIFLLCVSLMAGTYLVAHAWLTGQSQKKNEFTVGEVEITLDEEFDPPPELQPGDSFAKKPCLVNTGPLPCYVRMRADFADSYLLDEELVTLDLPYSNKWIWGDDGYYYYTDLLEPGERTEPLFTTVHVSDQATDTTLKNFEIYVYGEAVQHDRHEGDCSNEEYKEMWKHYAGGES